MNRLIDFLLIYLIFVVDPTKEHINFLRLCWILSSIAPGFVRKAFNYEFHPEKLYASLKVESNLIHASKVLNAPQRKLLSSKDGNYMPKYHFNNIN